MKAARFDYTCPLDVGQALAALASAPGEAKLLAGGQSLGPMLNLRLVRPALLVDISRLEALGRLDDQGGQIFIGAGVTHAAVEDGAVKDYPILQLAAAGIGYRAIRNRGTIGGSLAHADPAADWPLVLAALGASLSILGGKGRRSILAQDFMRAAFTTVLEDEELIEGVSVPRLSDQARWGFYKFCRKTGEFPMASAVVVLDPVRRVHCIYAGALDGAPRPLASLAQRVAQEGGRAATFETVLAEVARALPGMDRVRRNLHAVAVHRALGQVFA